MILDLENMTSQESLDEALHILDIQNKVPTEVVMGMEVFKILCNSLGYYGLRSKGPEFDYYFWGHDDLHKVKIIYSKGLEKNDFTVRFLKDGQLVAKGKFAQ